jgi:hypothetical protein
MGAAFALALFAVSPWSEYVRAQPYLFGGLFGGIANPCPIPPWCRDKPWPRSSLSNVIQFRDPYAPLESAERKAAIKVCWKAAEAIAADTVAKAFSTARRQSGCGSLSCEDALPLLATAFRRELRKIDYCLKGRAR